MLQGLPIATPGLRVGLLGGSFDPPHAGHVHITREALKRLGLHKVWWLVSPGNPLKPHGPADLTRRLAACRRVMRDPSVEITDAEARLGTVRTHDTLRALRAIYPQARFVWLMGADNLATFHRWERWQDIARMVPIAVLPRPGAQIAAGLSPAARRFAAARLRPEAAKALPDLPPPAWTLLPGPMSDLSSTSLRAAGRWPARG
ncbi:MAG: nicotinate-nucleotide adenylyltransferase [Pseudomonadota bacterium]